MDIVAIVNELREELQQIDNLILALDRLQSGRRRGRPPTLLQQLRAGAKPGVLSTRRSKTVRRPTKKLAQRGRLRKKTSRT